jgi:hypothetical protein
MKRVWLGTIVVLLSFVGAGLVTKAASTPPYIEKTSAFAMFCWFIATSVLVVTIYLIRTPSSKNFQHEKDEKKDVPRD